MCYPLETQISSRASVTKLAKRHGENQGKRRDLESLKYWKFQEIYKMADILGTWIFIVNLRLFGGFKNKKDSFINNILFYSHINKENILIFIRNLIINIIILFSDKDFHKI